MTSFTRLAGISAALAAAFVVLTEAPSAESHALVKAHHDRIAPEPERAVRVADASAVAIVAPVSVEPERDCRETAWPYVREGCLQSDGTPARRAVRTITIERRDAPNTSTLVRVPLEPR